ncbi:pao retrotransposon peptidase domain-containing protein [Ditylenchus destructor]|uniref:Pao retrotransposon peptidase domain-containing protein n=1 Tax=Ditylenchus destructor TaxID=166010 RepID=A0AAD4MK51_9BILA|nr:pao retrotransposon peptidase domain-containing protein [Ditylenchus destructor]
MTLAFRNQLSQTAKQMRTLLASPPPDWHAADDESPALSLLALEEEIAVNTEHSDALYNEAARFEEGQRLFLSAFGKLPAGAKDAEQKVYDDLLAEIRIDELQTECRQLISTLARRIRAYKRKESDLRAHIAQEQSRAAAHVTLEDDAGRDVSFLRDTVVGPIQQMLQQNQIMMQTMLQALNLQNRPESPATPVHQPTTTAPAVSTVSTGPAGSTHTAATFSVPQSDANTTLHSGPLPVSSVPGGPLPVFTTAPTPMMPIFTSINMGAQSTFTPHSSHWTTPPGTGLGGQHQGRPQYFSSPFVPQMPSNAVPQAFSTQSRFHLPLPTLEIPHFSGERSKWRPFWHKFGLVIQHHPELSDLEKHTLLLNYLKGDAKKLVDGIPEAEGNFQIVIDILRDEYDNRPQLVRDLYSQLQKLESATSLSKLKELYFGFVRICRQLEIEGESPNHNPLLWKMVTWKMVYDKMATSYLSKLLAKKPVNSEWTALSIQTALREVIQREEELAEHKTEKPKNTTQEKTQYNSKQHHTVLSAVANQKKRAEPQWPCTFCQNKGHWPDDCHNYPDHETRVRRAKELHYCLKCLQKGHNPKNCTKTPSCFFCKGKHKSALCREKFEQKGAKKAVNTIVAKEQEEDHETLDIEPGTKLVTEAQIFNPENPSKRITALLTLDTHSHITVISEEFYKRLALTVDKRVQLNIAPFGDGKSIRFNTNKVRFGIQLLNRNEAIIDGYTKKTVTVPVPIAVMKQEDIKSLANKGFPIQFRAPDILIGIDNFHAFQVQSGNQLPSGFHLSASKLGPLITSIIEVDPNEAKQTNQTLDEMITDHFALDSAGINEDYSKSDEQIHEEFQNALTFSDGQYQVCLPKKEDVLKKLPSNYALALGRLQSLFKSLRKRPKVLEEYDRVIREQLDLVFGLICSPFLLAATIREHLRRINSTLALHIDENHYVDDVHLLAQSPEEGYKMCLEAKQIFKEAGMNLRSFNSNAKDILTRLDPTDVAKGQFHKVLGIKWDTENDEFHFSLPIKLVDEPTKTSVLSTVAGIYDPIGFLTPILLPAKIFFQTLWTHEPKLDWTTHLPKVKTEEWDSIIGDWSLDGPIRIPRQTTPGFVPKSYELHVFSDASSYAYAAVAYLRTLGDDQAHSSLIFSKSRVKPTSGTRLTIPRLEMLGLVLGTRVLKLVKQELKLPIARTTIWTDSECVLHWVKENPRTHRHGYHKEEQPFFLTLSVVMRSVGYVLKFVKLCSKGRKFENPILEETSKDISQPKMLSLAEAIIFQEAQRRTPPTEPTGQNLGLSSDKFGLLRVKTRLGKAKIGNEAKRPIFLAATDPVASLYVKAIHSFVHHAGPGITLASIRRQVWIPQGRRYVSNLIRNCVSCKRFTAKAALTPADFLHPGTTPIKTGVPILGEDGNEPYMPKVGDLVLIHDENLPRGSWIMARVMELLPSPSDGLIREVKVKTATGTLNRAPRHLYLLETSGEANTVSRPYKQPMVAKPHPTPETQAKHQMLLRPRRKQNRCSNCSNSPCRCAGTQPTVILNSSVEMRLPPRSITQCQDAASRLCSMPTRARSACAYRGRFERQRASTADAGNGTSCAGSVASGAAKSAKNHLKHN